MAPIIVNLPLASLQLTDLRASCKRLVGCYAEPVSSDNPNNPIDLKSGQPAVLRRWPGITTLATPGPIRGIWEMSGQIYIVVGSGLFTLSESGATVLVSGAAVIPGTGFVRMTDNTTCLVILVPGTDQCFTYTPFAGGGGFQQLTNAFFLGLGGALDCWFVDGYIVFLANNNPSGLPGTYTFFNDDGKQVSGNAQITFTTAASFTRQFGTDPFYAMCIDHRELIMFGSRTTEGFVNTGNATGSPFSTAADTYMPYGTHPACTYAVALQDNSPFWVANDLTVRRRSGQTPVRVSTAGVEAILQLASENSQLTGCYALTPSWNGHPFYVLTIPLIQRTLVYDCVTQEWFDLVSTVNGQQMQWQALVWYNGFGLQLIGSAVAGAIGYLDPTTYVEYGNATAPVQCAITCQPIYAGNNRVCTRRIELMMTAGQGPTPGAAPKVDLLLSDNWGETFTESGDDTQTLGVPGDTDNRAVWWNQGQHRSLVPQFRITDASTTFAVDIQALIEVNNY
jgi:hypothetical protein